LTIPLDWLYKYFYENVYYIQLISCIFKDRQMKLLIKSLTTIFIVLVLLSLTYASEEENDYDKNLKHIINSLDLENKKFAPSAPENEFQEVMGEYMKEVIEQNSKTQKAITLIGPIEFEAMSDLANADNIQILRENIKQYKKTKKAHYDTLDVLMRDANIKIGKKDLAKKRLGGSTPFYEEKLGLFFLYDLDKFYEFLLKNHDKFLFQGEEIYGTEEKALSQYNVLREKMVKSANNINKTQELKNTLLKDRMEELKEWAKEN